MIPIGLLKLENSLNIILAIILILLYFVFIIISKKVHIKYLSAEEKGIIKEEEKNTTNN